MFTLDHLMVEVNDPLQAANLVIERLGLTLAWPLTSSEDYTSIGVNFGDLNIEFIRFNVRFGICDTQFNGFSGVAYETRASVDEAKGALAQRGLNHRIGEAIDAHTTITVEESKLYPTLFLVKYNFNTEGWKNRLAEEFEGCLGGAYNIGRLKSLNIKQPDEQIDLPDFDFTFAKTNQLIFESRTGEHTVMSDLIENLELVIG